MALPLYSEHDILTTGIDGTRTVLAAAERAGIGRFVHISSTAVYGIPDHHPLVEDDQLDGVGPYGQAKVEAERVCAEFRRAGMVRAGASGPRASSAPSGWASSPCSTTGPRTAAASR